MTQTVTSRIEFEMSYLMKIAGKYNLEAHRVRFEAMVESNSSVGDLIIRFNDLRRLMKNIIPDGSVVFSQGDINLDISMKRLASIVNQFSNPVVIIPTLDSLSAECILQHMTMELKKLLDDQYPGVEILETRFRENSESYVTMRLK